MAADGKGDGLLDGAIDFEGEEDGDTNEGCVDIDGIIDGNSEGLVLLAIVGNCDG